MNRLANATPSPGRARWFMGAEIRWGMWVVGNQVHKTGWALVAMVLLALPAGAQLQIGDNLSMHLSGNLGFQYAGSIDQGESSHGNGITGNADLTGSYYNPNFLSFNVSPFYNRTESDSTFGALTNTRGVGASVNLFSGSHFPGTVSYSKIDNSTGNFGIPGSDLGLATNANTQSFSAGWSAIIPNWPTFTIGYILNGTNNSILGEEGSNHQTDRTLNLLSSYKIDGWRFSGQFTHRTTDESFTNFANPQGGETHSNSSSNNFGATAQHSLPFSGNFGVNLTHIRYSYNYDGSDTAGNSGGSTSLNANAAFHPTKDLGVALNANYNDSLLGNLPQQVLNTGTPLDLVSLGSFHSFLAGADVYYQVFKNLSVHADINHQYQTFLGESYSATQFSGSANYNFDRSILKGLSFSLSVVDTAQQASNTGLGFVGTLNYSRKFSGWDVTGNFSYAQNVETTSLVYTTSSYNYVSSVRRRLGDRAQWLAGYSGSHSGITANSGTTSSAERAFTTLFYRMYNFNAFYTKSNGQAILTANGLVPVTTTLPTQVLNGIDFTQYNSKGWGFGVGATPLRRLVVSFAYAKSDGSTIDPILSTFTNNTLINASLQYRLRKVFVNGGCTHLTQNLGLVGTTPVTVTSFYIGLSRWFNFF